MKNMEQLKNTNRLVIKTTDARFQKLIISRAYIEETKGYQLVILDSEDNPIHNTIIGVNKISINNNFVKIEMGIIENCALEQYDEDETTPIYQSYIPYSEDDIRITNTKINVKKMNIEYIRGDIYLIEELIDEKILNATSTNLRDKLDLPVYEVLGYDHKRKKTRKISTHF